MEAVRAFSRKDTLRKLRINCTCPTHKQLSKSISASVAMGPLSCRSYHPLPMLEAPQSPRWKYWKCRKVGKRNKNRTKKQNNNKTTKKTTKKTEKTTEKNKTKTKKNAMMKKERGVHCRGTSSEQSSAQSVGRQPEVHLGPSLRRETEGEESIPRSAFRWV